MKIEAYGTQMCIIKDGREYSLSVPFTIFIVHDPHKNNKHQNHRMWMIIREMITALIHEKKKNLLSRE